MSEHVHQVKDNTKKQPSGKSTGSAFTESSKLSPHLTPEHILRLQRTIGNHAVQRLLAQQKNNASNPEVQRFLFPIVITERRRLASGSKEIGPGIRMSWTNSHVSLNADMEIYGALATAEIATQMQNTINSMWNASFGADTISCTASVTYRDASASADGSKTQISIYRGGSPSSVSREWLIGNQYMSYNLNSNINWTPAHEFGHLLGLDDRYSEGIISQIAGVFGGERESIIQEGWAGNIMAEHGGVLEAKNIRDLLGLHAYESVIMGSPESSQPEMA